MEKTKLYVRNISFVLYKNVALIITLIILAVILGLSGFLINYSRIGLNAKIVYQIAEDWITLLAIIYSVVAVLNTRSQSINYNIQLRGNNQAAWGTIIIFNIIMMFMFVFVSYMSNLLLYATYGKNIVWYTYSIKIADIIGASISLLLYTLTFSSIAALIAKLILVHKGFSFALGIYAILLFTIYLATRNAPLLDGTFYSQIIHFFFYEKRLWMLSLKLLPIAFIAYGADYLITERWLCV